MRNEKTTDIFIVLLDIRSVHNVASVFRTADCLGIPEIILVGHSPSPLDRFGRARRDFVKVALGAEKTMSWKHFPSAFGTLKFLKNRKVRLVALEQAPNAVDYRKVKIHSPTAFIFGNEVNGIPASILKKCDVVAQIPMRGKKESLNVSVAAGIALAQMLNHTKIRSTKS